MILFLLQPGTSNEESTASALQGRTTTSFLLAVAWLVDRKLRYTELNLKEERNASQKSALCVCTSTEIHAETYRGMALIYYNRKYVYMAKLRQVEGATNTRTSKKINT